MPNPPLPLTPNFQFGTGRLAVDRLDFESHVIGTNFRHQANQIDLFPTVVISGNTHSNVETAIQALAAATIPPVIPIATTTRPGIIQLIKDLSGSDGYHVTVVGLQGFPINTLPPSVNNVLTWNGTAWTPAPSAGVFTAAGDLAGSASMQNVIGVTGTGTPPNMTLRISSDILQFINTAVPHILQTYVTNTNASNMVIKAQGVSTGVGIGGGLVLAGGKSAGGVVAGGVGLTVNGDPAVDGYGSYMFQVAQPTATHNVAAFFPSNPTTGVTATDMPMNSGSDVIFIGNALSAPSVPSSTGAILWAAGGFLKIMQSNGQNFVIGTTLNPNTWTALPFGSVPAVTSPANGEINFNVTATSAPTVATNVLTYALALNTNAEVYATFIGKRLSSTDSATYIQVISFVEDNAGSIVPLGTLTTLDSRNFGGGSGWTAPVIHKVGSNVLVDTGFDATATINWTITIKITLANA